MSEENSSINDSGKKAEISLSEVVMPGVGELVNRTCSLFIKRVDVILLLIISSLPLFLAEFLSFSDDALMPESNFLLLVLVTFLMMPVVGLMSYYIVANRSLPLTLGQAFRWLVDSFWSITWIVILQTLTFFGLLVLCVVPFTIISIGLFSTGYLSYVTTNILFIFGLLLTIALIVYLTVLLTYTIMTFIREGYRGFDALARSCELISGSWWAIAWRTYIVVILIIIMSSLVTESLVAVFDPRVLLIFTYLIQIFSTVYLLVSVSDTHIVKQNSYKVNNGSCQNLRKKLKILAGIGFFALPLTLVISSWLVVLIVSKGLTF